MEAQNYWNKIRCTTVPELTPRGRLSAELVERSRSERRGLHRERSNNNLYSSNGSLRASDGMYV